MSGEIAKLFVTLGIDDSDLQKSLKGLQSQMTAAGKEMTLIGGTITAAMAGAVYNFTSTGAAIDEMSAKTGMSTETLSALKYAAEQTGGSIEGLETATKLMSKGLGEGMLTGKGQFVNAMKDIGLSIDDLKGKTPDQQFMMISDALANVTDPAEKADLAIKIFGKSGTDMLPMLADGSTGLQDMMNRAKDLGVVFDQTSADSAVKMKQGMNDVKTSMQGLADNIGSTLVPVLVPLVQKITSIIESVTNWAKAHPELARTLIIVVAAIGGLMAVLGPLLIMLPMIAAGVTLMLGPVGLIIAAVVAVAAIAALIMLNWDKIKAFFENLWNDVVGFFRDNWAKILAILFPAVGIPILIAQNWGVISDFFSGLWDDVLGFFKKVWDWLGDNWPYFLGLPGLIIKNWGVISGFFAKMWTDIETGFKDAVNFLIGLAEGWVNIWIKGINLIIGALDGIKITIPDWIPGIGGKSFGIDISPLPEISLPRLAAGGIVTSATMALIGEAGPEAVIPLDQLGNNGAGGGFKTGNFYLMLDKREVASILGQPLIDEMRLRIGARG